MTEREKMQSETTIKTIKIYTNGKADQLGRKWQKKIDNMVPNFS